MLYKSPPEADSLRNWVNEMTTDQKQDEAAAGMLAEMNNPPKYHAVWYRTAKTIRTHMKVKQLIDNDLLVEGVDLLVLLMDIHGSLRAVARKTKLSPTYLSQVLNSQKCISHGAFLKLVELCVGSKR